jgi:hypothetical protein
MYQWYYQLILTTIFSTIYKRNTEIMKFSIASGILLITIYPVRNSVNSDPCNTVYRVVLMEANK